MITQQKTCFNLFLQLFGEFWAVRPLVINKYIYFYIFHPLFVVSLLFYLSSGLMWVGPSCVFLFIFSLVCLKHICACDVLRSPSGA